MFQKVTILGNLGNDPTMRFTSQGDAVTSFRVATNRRWTNPEGEPGEETVWFQVSVWGAQAESCNQYLAKGRQVFVEGRLVPDKESGSPRIWTTNEGQPRASYELRALTVQFLGSGNGQTLAEAASQVLSDDDIPF
ncbi:MAG: single-stranded DNA-binding protein [Chloroflexota bacterium]